MDTQFEKLIGPLVARSYTDASGVETDPLLANWVNRVGNEVAAQSPRKDIKEKFGILGTDITNAFALPGGYVFVSRGLLDSIETDDELACVLAHETGHVAKRHATQQIGTNLLVQIVAATLFTGKNKRIGTAIQIANIVWTLHKSREMETQADDMGVQFAHEAGYDANGLLKFFDGIGSKRGSVIEQYFSTHPTPEKRLEHSSQSQYVSLSNLALREKTISGYEARGLTGLAETMRHGGDPLALTPLPAVSFSPTLESDRADVMQRSERIRASLSKMSKVNRVANGLQQLLLVNSQLNDVRWIYLAGRAYAVHNAVADLYARSVRTARTAPGAFDALARYSDAPPGSPLYTNSYLGREEVRASMARLEGVNAPLARAEAASLAVLTDLNNRFLKTKGTAAWLRYGTLEGLLRYAESELARADKQSGQAWRLLSMARVRRYEARLNELIPMDSPERRMLWYDLAQRRLGTTFPNDDATGGATIRAALSVELAKPASDIEAETDPQTTWTERVLAKKGVPENIATVLRMLTLDLEREIAARETYFHQ